jgi:hypothetical protein
VGRRVDGVAHSQEAAEWAERAGCPTARAQAAYATGLVSRASDTDAAERLLRQSAEFGAEAGNRWIRAFALTEVHWLRADGGDRLGALADLGEVIETWLRGGDWANLWLSLRHVFGILVQLGSHDAAAVLHGKLVASGATSALPSAPSDMERLADEVRHVEAELGEAAFVRAVELGEAMSDREAVTHLRAEIDRLTGRAPSRPQR